jgi:putative flippase GtrA
MANTAVGLFAIFGSILFFNAGPVLANSIGYSLGLIISFVFNNSWTFGNLQINSFKMVNYFYAAVLAYLLNLSVVILGSHYFFLDPYWIQFLGMCVYTTSMFFICRRLVFRVK